MPLSEVTTPDGKMSVAGPLRPNVAALVNLYVAGLVLTIIRGTVGQGVTAGGPIISVFLGVVAFAYVFLAQRRLVPSLGVWALGLRRYPCKVIEEYTDKGSLFVFERLPADVYTRRTIISAIAFLLLHLVAYAVVRLVEDGSA